MHFFRFDDFGNHTVYGDAEAFFADLAEVFRQEIAALVVAGSSYIQLDEVALALLCDPAIRNQVTSIGGDPRRLVELYIDGINQAVAECPADVVIGVHMCRGNFKGHYLGAGSYESVAEQFFAKANVNHFLLEYDTVNAAAKMHRLAGAKIHQRCWQEGPRTGGLSSDIRLGRDYPPVCPSWHGVSGSCSD